MATLHSIHPYDCLVGARAVTVRRGNKWYFDDDGNLNLCHCRKDDDHVIVGHGRVLTRTLISFSSLTDHMLVDEHEESSRTVAGVLASMRRAYGDDFSEDERVTILAYWRTD